MKHYIGVDLGGTNIAAGIVTENGAIIHQDSVPTLAERGSKAVMKDISALCEKIITDSAVSRGDIVSVGIGSPGLCDSKNGVVAYSNNIMFKNTPICDVVGKKVGLPTYVSNDANCAALGESICGAAKAYDHSMTVTLGTGIGGGIIIGRKIVNGKFGGGGEVGHHTIQMDGELCTCGKKGCWEAYASVTALIRQARCAVARFPQSALAEIVNHDLRQITGRTVFEAADRGDETAENIIRQYLTYVSCGLANLINILQPEIVLLGGGLSAQGERILAPIRKMVPGQLYGARCNTQFAIAALGNNAGIIGAALQKAADGTQKPENSENQEKDGERDCFVASGYVH